MAGSVTPIPSSRAYRICRRGFVRRLVLLIGVSMGVGVLCTVLAIAISACYSTPALAGTWPVRQVGMQLLKTRAFVWQGAGITVVAREEPLWKRPDVAELPQLPMDIRWSEILADTDKSGLLSREVAVGWPLRAGKVRWDRVPAALPQPIGPSITTSARPMIIWAHRHGITVQRRVPLQPIWIGLCLNWLFYSGIVFAGMFIPIQLRELARVRHRRSRGSCVRCGYEVAGIAGVCPECGVEVAALRRRG